jgi:hypothetical protein
VDRRPPLLGRVLLLVLLVLVRLVYLSHPLLLLSSLVFQWQQHFQRLLRLWHRSVSLWRVVRRTLRGRI